MDTYIDNRRKPLTRGSDEGDTGRKAAESGLKS